MVSTKLIDPLDPHFLLYQSATHGNATVFQKSLAGSDATDHGLRFGKFFGRWQRDGSTELIEKVQTDETDRHGNFTGRKPTSPILDWLDPRGVGDDYRTPGHAFKTLTVGQSSRLTEARGRLEKLATARGGTHFQLSLVSRLLIGIGLPHPIENGFLFHPTLGVPYLPGTALKQVARNWAEEEVQMEPKALEKLFKRLFGGAKDGVGRVAFLDALPEVPVTLTAEQITNHYPGYYRNVDPAVPADQRDDMHQPADWDEPNPVSLLAVEASLSERAQFSFALLPLRGADPDDLEKAAHWLKQGLEVYGVGARTTLGFGRFQGPEKRPLEEGDQVRIIRCATRLAYEGRTGVINRFVKTPTGRSVQLTPTDNAGRLRGTFPEEDVERIESRTQTQ